MDPILIALIIVVIGIAVALGVVFACVKRRKKGKEVPRESKSHDELIDESRKRIESNYKRCRALLESISRCTFGGSRFRMERSFIGDAILLSCSGG